MQMYVVETVSTLKLSKTADSGDCLSSHPFATESVHEVQKWVRELLEA